VKPGLFARVSDSLSSELNLKPAASPPYPPYENNIHLQHLHISWDSGIDSTVSSLAIFFSIFQSLNVGLSALLRRSYALKVLSK